MTALADRLERLRARGGDPVETLRRSRGVVAGEWGCPSCGETYPPARAPRPVCACGRPLPRRCEGIPEGHGAEPRSCDAWVEPEWGPGGWYERTWCRDCLAEWRRQVVVRRARSVVPAHLLDLALPEPADYGHRTEALEALEAWIDRCCGRADSGPRLVYLHGNVGAGKSVAAAWATVELMVRLGDAEAAWIREPELLEATRHLYGDDAWGGAVVERIRRADVLVLDELASRTGPRQETGWTPHAARVVAGVLLERLEAGAPTLVTSNEPPRWAELFDSRVESRASALQRVVECSGPDLRREGGSP